jgi:hypothetical protein
MRETSPITLSRENDYRYLAEMIPYPPPPPPPTCSRHKLEIIEEVSNAEHTRRMGKEKKKRKKRPKNVYVYYLK